MFSTKDNNVMNTCVFSVPSITQIVPSDGEDVPNNSQAASIDTHAHGGERGIQLEFVLWIVISVWQ